MEMDMKTGIQSNNKINHQTDKKIRRRSWKKPVANAQSKISKLVRALNRPNGTSIGILCKELSWQAHSVRSAVSGLRKNGLEIKYTKSKSGVTIYKCFNGNASSRPGAVLERYGSA